MLTNERAEMLANYLVADSQRAQELLDTPVNEALAKINAEGYDFTVEELQEFDRAMASASESPDGELSADTLEEVAGGVNVVKAQIAAYKLGLKVGYWCRKYIESQIPKWSRGR